MSEQTMTFWDHLEDLRKCIIHIAAAFVSVAVVLFFFKGFLFDSIILAPSQPDFFIYRLLGIDLSLSLVTTPKADRITTRVGNSKTIPKVRIVEVKREIYELNEKVFGTSGLT